MSNNAMSSGKQAVEVLEGGADGVIVSVYEGKAMVDFPYSPTLVSMLREVDGAAFDKEQEVWMVPVTAENAEKLNKAVESMRKEAALDSKDQSQVMTDVRELAIAKMHANGSVADEPKISDFHERGKRLAGDILAANGRWAAQFTGFGKEDGAAFIVLHRQAELTQQVFKGDDVAVTYGEKGRAVVESGLTQVEKLDESLGKDVDGVKVEMGGDGKYKVSFDYSPALSGRIGRIEGAEFNKEEKVWEVAGDKKDFLARAVNDMRKEVVADQHDLREMESVASESLDGAILKSAFTKDGTRTSGEIKAVNDHYVLQHTGREYFAAHRADAFKEKPSVGQSVSVLYEKGRAQVQQREKAQSVER